MRWSYILCKFQLSICIQYARHLGSNGVINSLASHFSNFLNHNCSFSPFSHLSLFLFFILLIFLLLLLLFFFFILYKFSYQAFVRHNSCIYSKHLVGAVQGAVIHFISFLKIKRMKLRSTASKIFIE